MTDVSVIIVSWNSEDEIKPCIDSIIDNVKNITFELIIIDNNSKDKTFELINKTNFSNLHTYKNNENLGFTKAVNQGIKYSKGENILLLNPDTIVSECAVELMNKFLNDNTDYGACAPLMFNENGTIQNSVRNFPTYWSMFCEFSLLAYLFPKSKLFGIWKMKFYDYTKDSDVQQPMASAVMIKKTVLEKVGIMDEQFIMFFNDVDLSKKILDAGYKIRLLTAAKVFHKRGASIYKDRIKMIKTWNKDCLKYFEKHHNNSLLLLWLKISLKISEILRISYYKLFKS
ncbi:MAG: glycosyltransferase family 2 protein [Chlorobi bacterium]|nr:glycosyltransferase family 2 protein [Chlorobiota bacterium]MCI0715695.1 glycosyltransferase family 2 protein [Chlorobiota bacterium]